MNSLNYYWDKLINLNRDEVIHRCLVDYDSKNNSYKINFLNEIYFINLNDRLLISEKNDSKTNDFELLLIILFYLVNAKEVKTSGELITCKKIKEADRFFTGSHKLPIEKLVELFGTKPELFLERGLSVGGKKLNLGDVSFELLPLPKIPIVYVLWLGDEEVSANISILFDKTIEEHLPIDIIHGLIKITTKRLAGF